jgi:hypothetical protein
MRICDDRYSRDRLRFDLALRFIQHEARTRTIRQWTGLTDDRIRKLYRNYLTQPGTTGVVRHRGKSPQQAAFFTRNPRMREETAVLASVCYLLGVMPGGRIVDAQRSLPSVQRGEALCEAFETYQHLVRSPRISFEHAVYLITALARGEELLATLCGDCRGLMVVDRFAVPLRRCAGCERTVQGELLPLAADGADE